MVRTCDQIKWPLQINRRHSTREKKKRKAKEKMGRQHQRVDRSRLQQLLQSESSRRPSEMAEDCRRCQPWCPYDPDGSGTQVTCDISDMILVLIMRMDYSASIIVLLIYNLQSDNNL